MKLTKPDTVLFTLNDFVSNNPRKVPFNKRSYVQALGVKDSSFKVYMSQLQSNSYIHKDKTSNDSQLISSLVITPEGKSRVNRIISDLDDSYLTPERHFIPSAMKVMDLFRSISSPYDRTFFLTVYTKEYSFNLPIMLESIKVKRDDSNPIHEFTRIDREDPLNNMSYISDIFNMTLYGDFFNHGNWENTKDNVNSILVYADACRRQGKLDEAEEMFQMVLSNRFDKTQNQWFQANIGLVNTYKKKNNMDKALKLLDTLETETKYIVHLAYIQQIRGVIHYLTRDYDRAHDLLTSAIDKLKGCKIPILLGIAYNNRGVNFFLRKQYKMAERDWKLSLKYARMAGSRYSQGGTLINLADSEILNKDLDKAEKYIKYAQKVYWDSQDLDGLAVVEFNWALFYLAKKNKKMALDHYELSLTVNRPLPFEAERMMRRKAFIERAVENGFNDIESLI